MVRHRLVLLIISMGMVSGWVTLSGSSIYQTTETVTPSETVTLSFTPTMPWCEYTPTKRYQDVIPVFEFGATSTSTIDPLATETPTPAPTETIIPSQTPTGTWYGYGAPISISRSSANFEGADFGIISKNDYCPGGKISGIHLTTNKSHLWHTGDGYQYWEFYNGTNFYWGVNDPNSYNLSAAIYPGQSMEAHYGSIVDSMHYIIYPYDKNFYGTIDLVICQGYDHPQSTKTPTSIPLMTSTPNCRPYEDTMADAEPFAEFDYNYIGNTCISLFDGIQLSLDDLPSVLLDAMDFLDTTGIFDISLVPELNVPGLEICLDQYEPTIKLMDVDLVSPLSVMITLVVIGGLINEFRS